MGNGDSDLCSDNIDAVRICSNDCKLRNRSMKSYHHIDEATRVEISQTKTRRVAKYQLKEDSSWVTKCQRPYELDIRVNPVRDIIRVAQQQGF